MPSNVDRCVQRAWPVAGIHVLSPDRNAEPVVDALEGGDTREAATPARLGHRNEIKHLFNARVEERHGTHDTGFVRDKKGESCQEVLRTILGCFRLRLRLDWWLLRAILGYLANDVEGGVPEGMLGGRTRVVGENGARELGGVLKGYREECNDR